MARSEVHALRHERLAERIRGDLGRSKPGDRIEPVRAMAKRYGVSITTLRSALRLLHKEGLVTLRQGCGSRVKQPPRSDDRHIAILTDLNILSPSVSPFFSAIVNRLRHILIHKGQSSRLYVGTATMTPQLHGLTCQDFLEDMPKDCFSGVAAVATEPHPSWVAPLKQRGVPIVGMDGPPGAYDAFVSLDVDGMLQLGAEMLIRQGCRKLAMVGWNHGNPSAFGQTVLSHGLVYRPEWESTLFHPRETGAGWSEWREIWMASNEKPDGLLVADDVLFPDVELAIGEMRLHVPRDLKIVLATSCGASRRSVFPVTRIECNHEEFAEKMANQLLALMAGREPANRIDTVGFVEGETAVTATEVGHEEQECGVPVSSISY